MAQNRGTLRTTMRYLLGETTAKFWTDILLNQWIEDALLDISLKTKCNRSTGYITTVASTIEYTISTYITDFMDIVGPVRIYDGTDSVWKQKMTGTSQDRMDIDYPGWEQAMATGEPTMYWYDAELDKIWIFMDPSSRFAGTNYLKIPYASKPAVTASDDAEPDVPETLYQAIIEFVTSRGYFSRGKHDIGQFHMGEYAKALSTYNSMGKSKEDQDVTMKVT